MKKKIENKYNLLESSDNKTLNFTTTLHFLASARAVRIYLINIAKTKRKICSAPMLLPDAFAIV